MAGMREGQGQLVFGLDIGTRSIVGTVGYLNSGKFHILAQRSKEHDTRAMLDGQIHDIGRVGQTITDVKEQLEEDVSCKLTEVCIAAAGRVLRTVTTHAEQNFEEEREATAEDIYGLCTLGVAQAYDEFVKHNDSDMKFYCVGYTPMRYYMNGYQIGNLEGHKVRNVAIDLIATFLPDDVVDGLYKAVELAGLHVANLTLEPIAAIQLAIPEKFRMLNMALVDVGAGTSDISITKDGTITAYGMIPVAGDSLTDIVVQHCLVDFETAENIKRGARASEVVEYEDIMGLPQTITAEEVRELLSGHVREMAKQVAACIKELNGEKTVSAVFVVGGGGTIPGYTECLAEELGIVKERVAIRGQEVMQLIEFENKNPRKDSMMVTPIGICLSYYQQSNNFIFVNFNGKRVKLYDNGRLTVADAAVQCELSNEDLFPKRGQALTFKVNGKSRIVRGVQGEAAVIRVNEENADIYSQVHNGDHIQVTPSTAGEAASLELGKLPELSERLHVYVNGTKISLPRTASVNGKLENEYYQIREEDDIKVRNSYTVREIAEFMDVPLGGKIMVNDTPAKADTRVYENFTLSWDVNAELTFAELEEAGEEEEPEEPYAGNPGTAAAGKSAGTLGAGAAGQSAGTPGAGEAGQSAGTPGAGAAGQPAGTSGAGAAGQPAGTSGAGAAGQPAGTSGAGAAGQSAGTPGAGAAGQYVGNPGAGAAGQPAGTSGAGAAGQSAGNPGAGAAGQTPGRGVNGAGARAAGGNVMTVLVNDLPVTLSGKEDYVFVDVFSFIDFDLKDSRGRAIVTRLNGRDAVHMEPLKEGDRIEVYWKEL